VTRNLWKYLRASPAIGLAVVLLPCLTAARTNDPPPRVLTLEDALDYALQHYPAVRASMEQIAAARSGVSLARTSYLPQLNSVYQASRATQNQVPGSGCLRPSPPQSKGQLGLPQDRVFGARRQGRSFPGSLWTLGGGPPCWGRHETRKIRPGPIWL